MKTKQIEVDGKKVTVWKMNFGFRSDYQDDATETKIEMKNGKRERSVNIRNGRMILMTLLYGIYESTDLGIPAPKSIEFGLSAEEKELRLQILRNLEMNTDKIFEEINKLNTEVDEEVIKNGPSSSQ
jgi:hypothetical protein